MIPSRVKERDRLSKSTKLYSFEFPDVLYTKSVTKQVNKIRFQNMLYVIVF